MKTQEAVQINRDPFARASLMRSKNHGRDSCRWCDRPGRFNYGWEEDGLYTRPHYEGPFCSVRCYRVFFSGIYY